MTNFSSERPTSPELGKEKPLRVLIAEDDLPTANLLRIIFSSQGHPLEIVKNAQDAIQKLREAHEKGEEYDLLITDKGLEGPPQEDGFFLVSRMREEELDRNTFVTMLTGSASVVRQENPGDMLAQKGIQALFGKPFSPKEFMKIIPQVREWQAQRKA